MATLFCQILEGELGSLQTSLCTTAGGTPYQERVGHVLSASRAPIKLQSGYKLGRKHTLRTSVTTGGGGEEWQGLGE